MSSYTILSIIGNTPLIQMKSVQNVFLKLEGLNPFGSIKDRTAYYLIRAGEKEGKLKSGIIVEPTSGNTGIALAYIGKYLGYWVKLIMPDTMTRERILLMEMAGAEVILTPGKEGMKGAIKKAEEIVAEEGAYYPDQFSNPANPQAHFETTAPEILNQLPDVDIVVAGIGTGGTITGIGRFFKEKKPQVKIIGIEPAESPFLTEGKAGPHGIQGIGAGFKPDNLDLSVVDEVITIPTEEAIKVTKWLFQEESVISGISSGAATAAAIMLSKKQPTKKIVTVLPDRGERYLSLFKSNGG